MNELGKRLQKYRLERDLSVSEVARRIRVSASTYRDWELGRQIKGEPYEKLASVFQVSLTELLTGKKTQMQDFVDQIDRVLKQIRTNL